MTQIIEIKPSAGIGHTVKLHFPGGACCPPRPHAARPIEPTRNQTVVNGFCMRNHIVPCRINSGGRSLEMICICSGHRFCEILSSMHIWDTDLAGVLPPAPGHALSGRALPAMLGASHAGCRLPTGIAQLVLSTQAPVLCGSLSLNHAPA